jgi:hypothetical protein
MGVIVSDAIYFKNKKLIGSHITPLFYYCSKQTFYPLQWIQWQWDTNSSKSKQKLIQPQKL